MPQSACHCSRNIWNCFSASLLFLYGTFGSQHRIASLTLSTLTDPTELHELLFMLLDAGRSAKGKGNACEDGLQGHEGNVFRSSYRTSWSLLLKFSINVFDQRRWNTNHTTHHPPHETCNNNFFRSKVMLAAGLQRAQKGYIKVWERFLGLRKVKCRSVSN